MSVNNLISELQFFRPSEELTKRIVELNDAFFHDRAVSRKSIFPRVRRKQVLKVQRTISERVYRFLASTARQSYQTQPMRVSECFTGMAIMLGFPPFAAIDKTQHLGNRAIQAIDDLACEFCDWLARRGCFYQAPWGDVRIITLNDETYLEFELNTESPGWEPQEHETEGRLPELIADGLPGLHLTSH